MDTERYVVDAAMNQLIGEWCLSAAPVRAEDADEVCQHMMAYLEGLSTDEAEYLLDKGLTRVYEESYSHPDDC